MIGSTEQRYVKFRSPTKGYETLVKTHAIKPSTPIDMKKNANLSYFGGLSTMLFRYICH
jgi:hypothetical protein